MKITIEQILSWEPCECYDTRAKIIKRTDEHWPKTPLEIADLGIPIEDRLWALLRPDVIDKKSLHPLACDFAARVLSVYETQYPDDNRPRKVIEIKRLWLEGKATDVELIAAQKAAYCAAADAAYVAAAARAAIYAAYAAFAAYIAAARAAYAAVDTAYYAAQVTKATSSYDTEREWQLERIKKVLKEVEK